ncbi:MAG: hypothetical protein EBU81_13185 [Proteobacteria bacterium]|nr:hypothetical protein [Pseudomonadota bacterium]
METLLWQVTPAFGAGIEEDEQLVVISKDQALRLRPQVKALSCRTWGEVKALGLAVYQEMLGMAGYGEYEDYIRHFDIQGQIPVAPDERTVTEHAERSATGLPDDEEPFDGESLPAFEDGDWPPMVAALVSDSVPGDILSEYGSSGTRSSTGRWRRSRQATRSPYCKPSSRTAISWRRSTGCTSSS